MRREIKGSYRFAANPLTLREVQGEEHEETRRRAAPIISSLTSTEHVVFVETYVPLTEEDEQYNRSHEPYNGIIERRRIWVVQLRKPYVRRSATDGRPNPDIVQRGHVLGYVNLETTEEMDDDGAGHFLYPETTRVTNSFVFPSHLKKPNVELVPRFYDQKVSLSHDRLRVGLQPTPPAPRF